MNLQPNDNLLHYRILEKLGEGGMGEVWKAVDTTLDRNVAIKVLPETFAADPERLARFEREAKTLAALSHPNIAGIYGLHPSTGSGQAAFLAMEYIEGEDLAKRLRRGPLPIDEAVAIAGAVAEALSAAHAIGVVHRDLKPANVMLKQDGRSGDRSIDLSPGGPTSAGSQGLVKVLDFGLAKATAPDPSASGGYGTLSPTITSFGTAAHVILGTAAYMAPEQARGRPVDKRADLWALGMLLLEMLTGKAQFAGETVSDTLAAVLKTEPDWSALPPRTPPGVRRLLRRLLEKDPRNRLHDAADARIELARAFDDDDAAALQPAAAAAAPKRGLLGLVAAAALVGGFGLGYLLRGPAESPPAQAGKVVSTIETPEGVTIDVRAMSLALSPDGRQLAFVGLDGAGQARLYVRALDSAEARVLSGTEEATSPFWSPDGREIAYFAGTRLMRIPVEGGTPRPIATVTGAGGSWNADGVIIVGASGTGPVVRIDAAGGAPRPVELVGIVAARWAEVPQFLPDGRHYLFDILDVEGATSGVYVGDLESGETRLLVPGYTNGVYADGRLLYIKDDTLMAWAFDPDSQALEGEPVPVASPVLRSNYPFHGFFSAAAGRLVYLEGGEPLGRVELVWVDRAGAEIESTGIAGDLYNPRLSRDGRRVALDMSNLETHGDIWVFDLGRGSSLRLTRDPIDESKPVWLPGDRSLAFFRVPDLYTMDVVGGAEVKPLHTSPHPKGPLDVSPDGRWLLFNETQASRDIRVLDLQSGQPRDWLRSEWREDNARFSPDGRWIAYDSNESGRTEIWIDSFPERGERFRVSQHGGERPTWRADGRELYYYSAAQQVMAVPVDMGSEHQPLGEPRALFAASLRGGYLEPAPDGQRFLVVRQINVAITSIVLEH